MNHKISRVIVCVLISILCVGCMNKTMQAYDSGYQIDSAYSITRETTISRDVDVSSFIDEIYGAITLSDYYAVIGVKDKTPFLIKLNESGDIQSVVDLTDPSLENSVPSFVCTAPADGMYVYYPQKYTSDVLIMYDSSGLKKRSIIQPWTDNQYLGMITPNDQLFFYWNYGMITIADDQNIIAKSNVPSHTRILSLMNTDTEIIALVDHHGLLEYMSVNPSSGELSHPVSVLTNNQISDVVGFTRDGCLLLINDSCFSEYAPSTGKISDHFSYTELGLSEGDIHFLTSLNASSYLLIPVDTTILYAVSTVQQSVERERLVVGTLSGSTSYLSKAVSYFNQTNQIYYAEIKVYDDISQLLSALSAGNPPDILELPKSGFEVNPAFFVDLLPLIQDSERLKEEDFLGSLLSVLAPNDYLPYLPDSVCIYTAIGRSEEVGVHPGISLSRSQIIAESKGDNTSVFPKWLTPDEMIRVIGAISLGMFIDHQNMTCNFQDESFINMLLFCSDCPDTFDPSGYTSDYSQDILLTFEMIQDPERFGNISENYNTDYTFIGFPNDGNNNGSFYRLNSNGLLLGIPSRSDNIPGAWLFMQSLYDDYWQTNCINGLSVMQNVFDRRLESVSHLKETDYDKINELIDGTMSFIYEDYFIREIIIEEAQSYFSGAKSAEEVSKIIQNRVSIYLSEHQ